MILKATWFLLGMLFWAIFMAGLMTFVQNLYDYAEQSRSKVETLHILTSDEQRHLEIEV